MEQKRLIPAILGILLILIGLIICVIFPDAPTRFYVAGFLTWLGVIFLAGTVVKKKDLNNHR